MKKDYITHSSQLRNYVKNKRMVTNTNSNANRNRTPLDIESRLNMVPGGMGRRIPSFQYSSIDSDRQMQGCWINGEYIMGASCPPGTKSFHPSGGQCVCEPMAQPPVGEGSRTRG
jgi:hypothetical protein